MRRLLITLILLINVSIVSSQTSCGFGVPCAPNPRPFPGLPNLLSPTPIPTFAITLTPTEDPMITWTPTFTATPTATPISATAIVEIDIESRLATIEYLMTGTPYVISDIYGGGGDDLETIAGELGDDSGLIFGYIRGLSAFHFGVLQPMVSMVFIVIFVVLLVKVATFILPILTLVWKGIYRVISLILDFIPF